MGVGEGAGFDVEIEEIVGQEYAEAKAVFDDSSVNASSDEWVSGLGCRLKKVDACVGMGGKVWGLHQHNQSVLNWWQCLPPRLAPASRLRSSLTNTRSALRNCGSGSGCILYVVISTSFMEHKHLGYTSIYLTILKN